MYILYICIIDLLIKWGKHHHIVAIAAAVLAIAYPPFEYYTFARLHNHCLSLDTHSNLVSWSRHLVSALEPINIFPAKSTLDPLR